MKSFKEKQNLTRAFSVA